MMRNTLAAGLFALGALAPMIADPQAIPKGLPLAEAYRSGTVKLVPVVTIDETGLPQDVFLRRPSDMACDAKGNVFVLDQQACQILKFDASGTFLKAFGRKGQGPGEFNGPSQIAAAKDRLLIYEPYNRRFSCLTVEGDFIISKTIATAEGRPDGMRGLPNGDFVIGWEVANFRERSKPQDYSIRIFSPDLELENILYQKEIWRNKYATIGGTFGNIPQPFSPLVAWDVTRDGKIVIGFEKIYDIGLYEPDRGRIGSFQHPYVPVKITERDREHFLNGIGSSGPAETMEQFQKAIEFPKEKPPFFSLMADAEGNILVWPYLNDPDEEGKICDAFSPEGRFLGAVRFEKAGMMSRHAVAPGGGIWMYFYDREGMPSIVKYKIESAENRL